MTPRYSSDSFIQLFAEARKALRDGKITLNEQDLDLLENTDIGSELDEKYTDYRSSRQDWEMAYTNGLDLLGFKYKLWTLPFQTYFGGEQNIRNSYPKVPLA